MSKKRKPRERIQISIMGDQKGQFAIGESIHQIETKTHHPVTSDDLKQVRRLLKELSSKIDAMVAPDKKDAALERVQELEQAITEKKPDLSTMEYVKNWFGKHIPALAGTVTSIIVHPIVGKLVEAGGDLLVKDFQRRFGEDS
jgi:hypothetical protein